MGKGQHKTYPKENTEKERALRKKIAEQEREIARLKSELKTLNRAFQKTAAYIKGNTDNISVEKMIAGAREEKTLVEIQKDNNCPVCSGELKTNRLPFGHIELCTEGCGYRKVENDS